MARYTHEFSQYPADIIEKTHYKNADSTIVELLNQIKAYEAAGNYSAAQTLISQNINTLKQYVLDSSAINRYVEEIRNIEIYVKAHKQQIYYQGTEPYTYADVDDVWVLEGVSL